QELGTYERSVQEAMYIKTLNDCWTSLFHHRDPDGDLPPTNPFEETPCSQVFHKPETLKDECTRLIGLSAGTGSCFTPECRFGNCVFIGGSFVCAPDIEGALMGSVCEKCIDTAACIGAGDCQCHDPATTTTTVPTTTTSSTTTATTSTVTTTSASTTSTTCPDH